MNRIREFFYGRNGLDTLGIVILSVAAIMLVMSQITGITPLAFVYLACVILFLARALSTNISSRRKENDMLISIWGAVRSFVRLRIRMIKELRTHKYFHCPKCDMMLRVPKGKGKISITCSRCAVSFVKKV